MEKRNPIVPVNSASFLGTTSREINKFCRSFHSSPMLVHNLVICHLGLAYYLPQEFSDSLPTVKLSRFLPLSSISTFSIMVAPWPLHSAEFQSTTYKTRVRKKKKLQISSASYNVEYSWTLKYKSSITCHQLVSNLKTSTIRSRIIFIIFYKITEYYWY